MDLKEEDDGGNDSGRQLFLVGAPRDPLVSAGAIVASAGVPDEINPGGDLQSTALAGLIGAQSSSVCFPTKFYRFLLTFLFVYLNDPQNGVPYCNNPFNRGFTISIKQTREVGYTFAVHRCKEKKEEKRKEIAGVAEPLWYPHELLNLVVIQLPLDYPSSVRHTGQLIPMFN
nr:uncharacterized protein LOC117226271 [Megalopta genalis]